VQNILDAILAGDTAPATSRTSSFPSPTAPSPSTRTRSTCSRAWSPKDKDPRKSLHVDEVPLPELGPGEALVAVMASRSTTTPSGPRSSSRCRRSASSSATAGSPDADQAARPAVPRRRLRPAGVVLRTGPGVTQVEARRPRSSRTASRSSSRTPTATTTRCSTPSAAHLGLRDQLRRPGRLALVKANQLMPKPEHLTWEEAASPGLVNSTAYRQLVSKNGGGMKQGDNVLIWGASGGLGGYATQYALNGGATRSAWSPTRRRPRSSAAWAPSWSSTAPPRATEVLEGRAHQAGPEGVAALRQEDPRAHRRRGHRHRLRAPGRETFGASVYVTRKGGTIVTCASTSGYMHEYDNRYLWMNLKRIISSHFANYRESWEANRLIARARSTRRCRGPTPSTRSARPRSTCTTTCTRARSACSASPPRRASASPRGRRAPAPAPRREGRPGQQPGREREARHRAREARQGARGEALRERDADVRQPRRPRQRAAPPGRGGVRRHPLGRPRRGRRHPLAGDQGRQGDPRRGNPRGRGHARRPAQGARRAARPDPGRRRAGAHPRPQRGHRPACLRPARGRPAPPGRPAGDPSSAPPPSATPRRLVPPPTARSRRRAAPSPSRRSASPRRPPTTTPAPSPRPTAWSRRPRTAPPPPRSAPARRSPRPTPSASRPRPRPTPSWCAPVARPSRSSPPRARRPRTSPAAGQAEAERELTDLRNEVARLGKRRDAIVAQLAQLRDVVAGFGEDVAVKAPSRSWAPGAPLSHGPFYIGFFGASVPDGVLARHADAGHRQHPGPDRRRALPRGRAQPGGDVVQSRELRGRRIKRALGAARSSSRWSSACSPCSWSRSCRSSPTRSR
jgi:crotonyl-CoA reductase